jgi:DNA primase
VEEPVLYNEIFKILRTKAAKAGIAPLQETRYRPAGQAFTKEEEDTEALTPEETEILRIMLKYCKLPLFEMESEHPDHPEIISVGQFIILQLTEENMIPEKIIFKSIFTEISEKLNNYDFQPERYFIHHPDKKISQIASDLLAEKFIESKRWNKAGAYTEKEHEILDWLVPRLVNEFKLRVLKKREMDLEKLVETLHLQNNEEELFQTLTKLQNLKSFERQLSNRLGNRAIM